jgi:predicted CoA-binding protein
MSVETVAVLGASAKAHRYSNKAMHMLRAKGHKVIGINPAKTELDGFVAVPTIAALSGAALQQPIDTVTVYVRAALSDAQAGDLIALKPKRVIFNPGAENEPLVDQLEAAGIATENACTLVLLSTNQF